VFNDEPTYHFLSFTAYTPSSALVCRARRTLPMHAPHASTTLTLQAMKSAAFFGARLRRASTILVLGLEMEFCRLLLYGRACGRYQE